MSSTVARFRTLMRNLAIAATAFTVIVGGLGQIEILLFLRPLQIPMVVLSACAWGAYTFVRTLANPARARSIASAEGPGGELVQKATLATITGTLTAAGASEAEERFARGERAFAGFVYSEAAKCFQASVSVYPSAPAYLNLGAALMNTSEFTRAEEELYIGLHLAERENRRDLQAAFLANLGIVHNRLGRLKLAMEDCEQAITLFRTAGDTRGLADVMLTIGNIHGNKGEWKEAERAYQTAMKRHKLARSEIGRANALGNIGNMHMQQDQSQRALERHQAALAIHEQLGNPLGKANALSNIGNLHFRDEDFAEALKAHEAALSIYRDISTHLGEATALGNIGNVQFKQGQLDNALDSYEAALEIHHQIGNVLGRANTMTNLGSLLSRMRRGNEALQMLVAARRLYEQTGARTRGVEAVTKLIARLNSHVTSGKLNDS